VYFCCESHHSHSCLSLFFSSSLTLHESIFFLTRTSVWRLGAWRCALVRSAQSIDQADVFNGRVHRSLGSLLTVSK
jgi:hypothetical protein